MPTLTAAQKHHASKKLALSERQVTEACIGWLRAKGWYMVRLQSGLVRGATRGTFMRLGEDGLPDWIAFKGTTYFFLEMKASGKKLGDKQAEWFRFAERSGFPAIWADGLSRLISEYQARFENTEAA